MIGVGPTVRIRGRFLRGFPLAQSVVCPGKLILAAFPACMGEELQALGGICIYILPYKARL